MAAFYSINLTFLVLAKIQQRMTLGGFFFNTFANTHLLYTFATCTFPNFSPNLSWDDCNTQEKLKTKVIQLLILAWREVKLLQGVSGVGNAEVPNSWERFKFSFYCLIEI